MLHDEGVFYGVSQVAGVKFWNQLDTLKGEVKLRHHLSNIMEYTFHFHKQHVTEQEEEKLIHILEKEGPNHEA